MKKLLTSIIITFIFCNVYSQGRIVVNNNAHITFSNGSAGNPAFIVIDNPNANALTTAGTGGHIHSEDEYHKIRWNIGTSTGTYSIPFSTASNVKIPFQMQITGAGAGGTHIDYSTYSTTNMNLPWPSTVTHMLDAATGTVDNSLNVIDRFWIMDAMNYATRPTTTLQFGYDPTETGGANTVTPGAMAAQRFNSSGNVWSGSTSMSSLFFGVDAFPGNNYVTGAAVPSTELFEAWTLSNQNQLLSVELTSFSGACNDSKVVLNWSTASEKDASHFVIEKSLDGQEWFELGMVNANGNTSSTSNYSIIDYEGYAELIYYRLTEIDINGRPTTYDIISVTTCKGMNDNIVVNDFHNGSFYVDFLSNVPQDFTMNIYTINGKKVIPTQTVSVNEGASRQQYNYQNFADGVYLLILENNNLRFTHKLVILD